MPTYTSANNIKKIGTGDESGTWGDSTNNNFDIIDRAANGFYTLDIQSLDTVGSGTAGSSARPYVLPLSSTALLSLGHYKALRLTSSATLTADTHLKLEGDNTARIYMMQNDTTADAGINVVVFQGTFDQVFRSAVIANNQFAILFADGSGASTSYVRHVTEDISPLTKSLTIVTPEVSAAFPQLTVESSDPVGQLEGPIIDLKRNKSSAGADDDNLGSLLFSGYNNAGTPEKITYAKISSDILSATDGAESGELNLSLQSNGSLRSFLDFGHYTGYPEQGFVKVNSGRYDIDFTVSGDNFVSLLGTDASEDIIFSGEKLSSSLATVVPRFQITGGGAGLSLLQTSDNAVGPTLTLAKTRGSTSTNVILQDNDSIGEINFVGSTAGTNGAGMSTVSRLAASISVIRDGGVPFGSSTVAGTMLFKTKYSDDTGGPTAPPDIRMTIRDTGAIGFGQDDSANTPATHSGGRRRRVLTSRGGTKGPVWYGTPGGVEFIASKTITSGDTTVVFDGYFNDTGTEENPNYGTLLFNKYAYDAVMFSLEQVVPTTNGHLISAQLSVTSGSYDTTPANYRLLNVAKNSLMFNSATGLSNDPLNRGLTQSMTLHSFASTAEGGGGNKPAIFSRGIYCTTGNAFANAGVNVASYSPDLDVSGIRFFPSTNGVFNSANTFLAGRIKMFGIRKSENPLYTSS